MERNPAMLSQSKRSQLLPALAVVAAIVAVHALAAYAYRPGDADLYLIPWYRHLVEVGRIRSFSHPFSNYTPPYLYLLSVSSLLNGWLQPIIVIRLLSCAGAIWLAWSVARLLAIFRPDYALVGGLASLLLPSIVLNVSVLSQADSFWVAACVLAVAAAIQNRLVAVAIWSGVAFAFKAQAVFFAPFVLFLFVSRKAPWWCWIIPPAIYGIAMLPAWFMGWPAWDLLTIYWRQTQWQPELGDIFVSNGASWWTIYGHFFPRLALRTFWIGYLTTVVAVASYLRYFSKRELSPLLLVAAAALSAIGVPFLLPGMHERFYILGDVLTFALAVADPQRRTVALALLMQLASAVPGYGWALGLVLLKLPACFFGLGALLLLVEYLRSAPIGSSTGRAHSQRLAAAR